MPRALPAGSYTAWASELANATSGTHKFGIDPTGPTGGSFLAAIIDSPTLEERWHQGGYVGYAITAIGAGVTLRFGDEVLDLYGPDGIGLNPDAVRATIRLRMRLLPYLYTAFAETRYRAVIAELASRLGVCSTVLPMSAMA